jgi:hypothetical protein
MKNASLLTSFALGWLAVATDARATIIFDSGTQTLVSGDGTQLSRLSRSGVPSDWSTNKAFPGTLNPTTSYHYKTFVVNPATPYVQVTFDDPDGVLFASAYLNAYTPGSGLGVNYRGDAGFTGNEFANPGFFQVVVPAGNSLVVVVDDTHRCEWRAGPQFPGHCRGLHRYNVRSAVSAIPTFTKQFGVPTVPLNGTVRLSFTIQNLDPVNPLTGASFSDTLPPGLIIATPNGLTPVTGCDGTVPTATAGTGTISLTGAAVPSNSDCTFSVNVVATSSGTKTNTTSQPTSTNAAPVNPATASSLTFTIQNPNAAALTGVGFTDPLPAGLVVSTPNGINPPTGCNGTAPAAVAGSSSISLSGATVAANSSCVFSVNVTAVGVGVQNNVTSAIASAQSAPGAATAATVTIGSFSESYQVVTQQIS